MWGPSIGEFCANRNYEYQFRKIDERKNNICLKEKYQNKYYLVLINTYLDNGMKEIKIIPRNSQENIPRIMPVYEENNYSNLIGFVTKIKSMNQLLNEKKLEKAIDDCNISKKTIHELNKLFDINI